MQAVSFSNTLKANEKNCTNIFEGPIKFFGDGSFLGMDGNRKDRIFFTRSNDIVSERCLMRSGGLRRPRHKHGHDVDSTSAGHDDGRLHGGQATVDNAMCR